MKLFHLFLTLSVIAISFSAVSYAQSEQHGKTKVVCFGDSITTHGYDKILGEILDVDTVMSGVGGHSTSMALRRIKKDVLDHKPDIVVILLGTNDLRDDPPKVYNSTSNYQKNLEKMIFQIENIGAKVALCSIPPFNKTPFFTRHKTEPFEKLGGLESMVKSYRDAAIETAKKHQLTLVDLNTELKKNPKWMSPDGVHPSKHGTRLIARLISEKVKPLIK